MIGRHIDKTVLAKSVLAKSVLAKTVLAGLVLLSAPGLSRAEPTIVVEASSGRVLQDEQATRPWYPASLSKLMTAYTVFKAIKQGRVDGGTPILISKRAARMAPSKMGYPVGTMVTIDDALKMLIVQSANDIAIALAEGVSGSVEAFAAEMNANSRALGMAQSHWVNPNGLPDAGQVSSARDMAILARALLAEFPEYDDLFGIQAIQSGKRVMRTHNALVYRYPGADGMKTGFICASGFNVVATASRGGRRLITVVMGSPSAKERTRLAADLFETGFRGSFGGIFGSSRTLTNLAPSSYSSPTDVRDIACNRKRRASRSAEEEEGADTAAPIQPNGAKNDGVMATLLADKAGTPSRASGPLLTSWVIAPPVPVGPYTGPRRPAVYPQGTAVAAAPADKAPSEAASFTDTEPSKPMLMPGEPVEASAGGGLGAIRPGAAPADAGRAALPGQIPRAARNPLANLTSDPLPTAKRARSRKSQANLAAPDDLPRPVPRPALSKKKKKKNPAPKT
jgi:D-alanyl-D-alanine carboxypeptidase